MDKLAIKIMFRTVLTVLLVIIVTLAVNIQPVKAEQRYIIGTYGEGYLEYVNGLVVLHVKGSPYDMGYQNGFLLKNWIQPFIQYEIQKMISMGYSYDYLNKCVQAMEPHIPQEYIEEIHGLADGASVNYTDMLIMQTISDVKYYGHGWTGCSGFLVFGNATVDGHLYHGRSLDGSLCTVGPIGIITVYEPENGTAFVGVGFPGGIGVGTGMNIEGVTVEVNISSSTNKTLDGMPYGCMLRKVLQYSNNLTEAIDIICQADRTDGRNILLGDGKDLNAAVVEISKNYCKVFWAGDPAEDVDPHYSIPNAVRRTNHYVDPELAATQRPIYDPRVYYSPYITAWKNSWDRYELLSQLIEDNYGNIDAQMAIEFLRTPPVAWAEINLQSVVFDSTDLELWVANSAYGIPAYQREFRYLSYDDLFPGYPVYLTISSTVGGNVTTPGEGTFAYDEGTLVDLVATAASGYQFVNWTGDVGTIGNVTDTSTNITMSGNYSITADFAAEIATATGTGTATFDVSAGTIASLTAIAEGTLPAEGKPNLEFPHGFFSFNITGLTSGTTVTVTIELPSAVPVGTQYWKYGPTSANPADHWYQLPMGDDDGDNVIMITLVDGGLGDDDLAANGVIVDQGGPGNPGNLPSKCAECGPESPCAVPIPQCTTESAGGGLLWSLLSTTYIMGKAVGDVTQTLAGTLGCWVDELAVPTFGAVGAITTGLGGMISGVGDLLNMGAIFDPIGEMLSDLGNVIQNTLTS